VILEELPPGIVWDPGSEHGRILVLLIAPAASEADVRRRLADDPWESSQRVVTTTIEPWELFVGADRLSAPSVTS
jgi:hypothetical protein